MFRFDKLHLENFRCFEDLEVDLEQDLTVLFAENGGGKTALLTALAMGLATFQRGSPKDAQPAVSRDPRQVPIGERGGREPAGPCSLTWTATVGGDSQVEWLTVLNPASGRSSRRRHGTVLEAIERSRVPRERWPLFAWYGTGRLGRSRPRRSPPRATADRFDAYMSSLDPSLNEASLLKWFTDEILSDAVRRREGERERFLDAAVAQAMVRATPGVQAIWFEPRERSPSVRFEDGHVALWTELSDGFHVYLALIADIARRVVMLNEFDAVEELDADEDSRQGVPRPFRLVEGVVLIDEIDLHLHPRWQRIVLDGLREVFPSLQFVVTTHSPQVLSSAKNRQVRRLVNWQIQEHSVYVEGRDSNSILREQMRTGARDEDGENLLRDLHDAIDAGRRQEAERRYADLLSRWGDLDPDLIRAKGIMSWEE
ncbi:MAG: AAA family ATPase [Acidobacteriota bacterium]